MKKLTASETLHLGIKAARAGLPGMARQHLAAVLKEQPDHIPALLWLAYVTSDPQDSLRRLKHVLTLDPNNEQAKSGLHWARRRLGLKSGEFPANIIPQTRQSPLLASAPMAILPHKTLRVRATPKTVEPKPNVSRLRYAFRILLVFMLAGFLGVVLGLGAPIFIPADTLAAWLPAAPMPPPLVIIENAASTQPVEPPNISQPGVAMNFSSASDRITLVKPQPGEFSQVEPAPVTQTVIDPASPLESRQATTNLLVDDTDKPQAATPSVLIGPALPLDPTPVDPSLLAHQPAYPGEKWIEVNVTTQEVTAWEGNMPVISFISSTGLPNTPTVLGEYNIYWKLEKTLMTGPGYYLPDVPYTMYFYLGYALHGTYWHDNFGQPMSRGCVNLSTDNAKKLFEWADPVITSGETFVWATADNPGTLVVVHQ